MSGEWWIAVVAAGALAWGLFLDLRYDTGGRLARWWVPRAKRQGPWAGPLAFLTSAAALTAYAALSLVAATIAQAAGGVEWALVVALPAIVVYAPFVFETMPSKASGYRSWRQSLAVAGADRRLQRAIAWWAGPPSIGGLLAMIATLLAIFGD